MPDLIVSGNVDTMLGAANNAAIRSAIGLGQTDAPTFAGLTATGALNFSGTATSWNNSSGNNLTFNLGGGGMLVPRILTSDSVAMLGADQFGAGLNVASTASIGFSDSTAAYQAGSPRLFKDAPGILAQRNVGSTQQFRLYNTTDAGNVNYERLELKLASGAFRIETARGGAGFRRSLILSVEGSPYFALSGSADASLAWWSIIASTGSLVCNLDNTYDIGASGANRPRDIYAAGTINSGSNVNGSGIINALGLTFQGRGSLSSQGNGILKMSDNTTSDFSRLQLGSTTDASPAIARDGAGIKFTGAAAGSTSWIKVPAVAVSALPSASTAGAGARSFVNDALTPVFGSAVTGGGAVTVPVYSTGSAWNVG
jgi:hypothetical protein